jgi:hypothetical protein
VEYFCLPPPARGMHAVIYGVGTVLMRATPVRGDRGLWRLTPTRPSPLQGRERSRSNDTATAAARSTDAMILAANKRFALES